MRCSRGHGLMLKAHMLDMEGGFGEMWALSWRCTNGGARYDAVIEQNQLAREAKVLVPTNSWQLLNGDDTYSGSEACVRPAA